MIRGLTILNTCTLGRQTLTYHCPTCGNEWEHARPAKAALDSFAFKFEAS
jgi:hypothetical protein